MDLFVFDGYELIGSFVSPMSISYTERVRAKSEFSVYLPMNDRNAQLAKEERIILFDNEKGIAGIITHILKRTDSLGTPSLTVTGSLCDDIMYRRICWGIYSKSGKASEVVYQMIESQITNPSNPDRAIPDFVGEASGDLAKDKEITYQSTGGNVGDNIDSICVANGFCRRVKYNTKAKMMEFTLYEGVNRTVNQSVVSPCVLSQRFENLIQDEYERDLTDSKNAGLVAGEGEGQDRIYVELGNAKGKSRREVFIDARNVRSQGADGNIMPPEEYKALLLQKGEEKMGQYSVVESFDCVVNTMGNIQYDRDFFLGDIVTIMDEQLGIQVDAEISEVEKAWSESGLSILITFGFGALSLAQKLKAKEVM